LEYGILLVVGVCGYSLKRPFGVLLHHIVGLPVSTGYSIRDLLTSQAVWITAAVLLASLVHRRTSLPVAPWVERRLYGMHRDRKIRIWAPGLLGALISLVLGCVAFFVAAHFGVSSPLGGKLDFSSLPNAVAIKLAMLYPAGAVGAAFSEEVLYRFGITSIIAGLLCLVVPKWKDHKVFGFWLPILASALVFGYVHVREGLVALPAGDTALQLMISPQTWAGVVFGYVFAAYGLEAAIVSHTLTDIVGFAPFVMAALKNAHH
jgi:hypothetical protein